ncbi:MAG: hypothetical protein IKP91_00810 [Bacteroidaceae bacterium]|nr:hypothetical protein [Bacteroidaceae bacterium]
MNTQQQNKTLYDVIKEYVKRGFGSMNKNDFEVWIFNYLLHGDLLGKSNYDISVELRMPESKVKRLRYEASLKYGNPTDTSQYNEAFKSLLGNVNLKKGSNNIVQFAVEDTQLRHYLDSILKKKGRFADTSFNTEVVSITLDDLAMLLDETCTENEKETFKKKVNGSGKIIDYLKNRLEEVANHAIEKGITTGLNMGLTALMNLVL